MKVLHFSTHDEACGIGKYQESFLASMAPRSDVENEFFDVSPNVIRTLNDAEYARVMDRLVAETATHDLLHIQHEWGFFSRDELARAIDGAHAHGKKVAVTLHTSPGVLDLAPARRAGLGPRAFLNYYRARRDKRALKERVIAPLLRADLLIVHNASTYNSIIGLGADPAKVVRLTLPVPTAPSVEPSTRIRTALNAGPDDIIMCTVGFLHRYKGVDAAIKALRFLPDNYKLAVIGGINPTSDDVEFYDELADLIRDLGVIDRVYITGYIERDDVLDSLVRECDIAVYPYDGVYYSQVSSAALNVALANRMTTVAYPTATFKEINAVTPSIILTDTFSYYELARAVRSATPEWPNKHAAEYSETFSYDRMSGPLVELYSQLV